MRKQTDYATLPNRCNNCGHRLIMKDRNRCTVITGNGSDPDQDKPCLCKDHRSF